MKRFITILLLFASMTTLFSTTVTFNNDGSNIIYCIVYEVNTKLYTTGIRELKSGENITFDTDGREVFIYKEVKDLNGIYSIGHDRWFELYDNGIQYPFKRIEITDGSNYEIKSSDYEMYISNYEVDFNNVFWFYDFNKLINSQDHVNGYDKKIIGKQYIDFSKLKTNSSGVEYIEVTRYISDREFKLSKNNQLASAQELAFALGKSSLDEEYIPEGNVIAITNYRIYEDSELFQQDFDKIYKEISKYYPLMEKKNYGDYNLYSFKIFSGTLIEGVGWSTNYFGVAYIYPFPTDEISALYRKYALMYHYDYTDLFK